MKKSSENKLFNSQFFLLWQGQALSKIGTFIFDIAMILWLKERTDSAGLIALILIASNIPEIILSPFGGTIADIFSRRKILILSDIISGILVTGLSVVLFFNIFTDIINYILIFFVSLGLGICAASFNPTVSAIIPDITDENKLHSANSIFQTTGRIAQILGQSVGGIFFAVLGGPILFLVNGVSFLCSAISESFLKIGNDKNSIESHGKKNITFFKRQFFEGYDYCRNNTRLKYFMLIIAVYHFFVAPLPILIPFFVTDTLKLNNYWLGFLLSSFTGGTLIGFTFAGTAKIKRQDVIKFISFILFLSSIFFVLLGIYPSIYVSMICLTIIGAIIGIVVVTLITEMQLEAIKEMRGRLFGFLNTVTNATIPIGLAVYGLIIDVMRTDLENPGDTAPIIFFINGIFIFIFMLILMTSKLNNSK